MLRRILIIAGIIIVLGTVIFDFEPVKGGHPGVNLKDPSWLWGGATDDSANSPNRATGLGWVSLTSDNKDSGGAIKYGLNIPKAGEPNSSVSGYAWTTNLGWIDFQPASGYPAAPTHGAKRVGNKLEGWARILSIAKEADKGPINNAGGWDGWFKLSGSGPGYNYGVTVDDSTGTIGGNAWSNELGFVDFNGSYSVPPNSPSADIKANGSDGPITIAPNTDVTISWSSQNVTSCNVLRNGVQWQTGVSNSGIANRPSPPLTTYRLDCTGLNGSVSDSVVVNVSGGGGLVPSADIKANNSDGPITIAPNTDATISWTSQNVTSCNVLRNRVQWQTGVSNSGIDNRPAPPVTTYRLDCTGPNGPASDSVVVNVSGGGGLTCSGSPNPVYLSGGGNVTWKVTSGSAPSYNWTFNPAPNRIVSGQGTQSIIVQYSFRGDMGASVNGVSCNTVTVKRFNLCETIPFLDPSNCP